MEYFRECGCGWLFLGLIVLCIFFCFFYRLWCGKGGHSMCKEKDEHLDKINKLKNTISELKEEIKNLKK